MMKQCKVSLVKRSHMRLLFSKGLYVNVHWCLTMYVSLLGINEPDKPGRPVINAVDRRQVTIGWTPLDSDGGSEISRYIVYYRSSHMDLESFVKLKMAGRSESCTFSKRMEFNRMYEFAVAVKRRSGIGPLSELSECVKTPNRRGNYDVISSTSSLLTSSVGVFFLFD